MPANALQFLLLLSPLLFAAECIFIYSVFQSERFRAPRIRRNTLWLLLTQLVGLAIVPLLPCWSAWLYLVMQQEKALTLVDHRVADYLLLAFTLQYVFLPFPLWAGLFLYSWRLVYEGRFRAALVLSAVPYLHFAVNLVVPVLFNF